MTTENHLPKLVVTLVAIIIFIVGAALVIFSLFVIDPSKTVLSGVGGFLVISVVMPYVYAATLKPYEEQKRKSELQSLLDEKIDQSLGGSYRRGLKGFTDEIDFVKIFNELGSGDVLWWLDTYAPDHKKYINPIQSALDRGAVINFLVLDPESDNCRYRASEITGAIYNYQKFKEELRKFWEDIESCTPVEGSLGKTNMRLYKDLPSIPMYIVCKDGVPSHAYTSFYLRKPTGYGFPHIRWEKGEMLTYFMDYMKFKWETNKDNTQLPSRS